MIRSNSTSFSADVKIELTIAGSRFEVGQLGPGFAFLRQPGTAMRLKGPSPAAETATSPRGEVSKTEVVSATCPKSGRQDIL